jgi:transposase-like protein
MEWLIKTIFVRRINDWLAESHNITVYKLSDLILSKALYKRIVNVTPETIYLCNKKFQEELMTLDVLQILESVSWY